MKLPSEIRHKLVQLFDIPRSGHTTVEYRANGAVVTSDGFMPSDLMVVTSEKMKALLNSESDNFYQLFEEIVDNIDSLLDGSFKKVEEVVQTWPQFVKANKGSGKTTTQLAELWKEMKANQQV